MCSKPEEAPASAVNLRKLEEYSGQKLENLWLYETHHGLCLREREANGYQDSDFYMLVWDEENQKPQEICFASTRGWSYPCYGSRVDATPEVLAKWNEWERVKAEEYRAARIAEEAKRPARGKVLKVVKGRNVPKGTTGECFWIGESKWGKRVGIKDAAGTVHWTAITNVEVLTGKEVSQ
jgi:hypothetical protein